MPTTFNLHERVSTCAQFIAARLDWRMIPEAILEYLAFGSTAAYMNDGLIKDKR
jgi:hypothetical protein